MTSIKQVSVRELQHNLADYLELAQEIPLSITKYGKDKVLIINPDDYDLEPKKNNLKKVDLLDSPFIGMKSKEYKNKSSIKIAEELRNKAWQGEIK